MQLLKARCNFLGLVSVYQKMKIPYTDTQQGLSLSFEITAGIQTGRHISTAFSDWVVTWSSGPQFTEKPDMPHSGGSNGLIYILDINFKTVASNDFLPLLKGLDLEEQG